MEFALVHETVQTKAISRTMQLEGDTLVENPKDAGFVLRGVLDKVEHPLVIGGDSSFPVEVIETMGFSTDPKAAIDVCLVKWWDGDGFEKGWSKQLLIGLPLLGTMNDNLGVPLPTGMAARYVNDSPMQDYFINEILQRTLAEMGYRGFVTISLSLEGDVRLVSLLTGVPSYGIFNLLEGTRGKISDFLMDPFSNPLQESWTVSLLLSRAPFPFKKTASKVFINNLTPTIEKHFWLFNCVRHRKSIYTQSTEVGVATAWAMALYEASNRATRTCHNICMEEKQFRTDASEAVKGRWAELSERGLV